MSNLMIKENKSWMLQNKTSYLIEEIVRLQKHQEIFNQHLLDFSITIIFLIVSAFLVWFNPLWVILSVICVSVLALAIGNLIKVNRWVKSSKFYVENIIEEIRKIMEL